MLRASVQQQRAQTRMITQRTPGNLLGPAVLLLGSGFCSLVYQTVWLRELRLVFGASTTSTAATLALFMAGLGIGGAFFGRRLERSPRPLWVYAALELGITLTAALSPVVLDGVRAAYLSLGGSSRFGDEGATFVRLGLGAIAIGAPAVLMGGTLPAIARAITPGSDRGRRGVAGLYGLNTVGAVAGVLLPTFLLFERFGFRTTLWLACLLNLFLATVAWALSTLSAAPEAAAQGAAAPEAAAQGEPDATTRLGEELAAECPRPFLLLAAFASGFVFFVIELVWYRLGAPVLGGSTYTFGVILACALLGIGLGGLLYALSPPPRVTLAALALTFSLEAAALLLPYALGDELALIAHALRGYGQQSFAALTGGWGLVTGVLVFPAALVAGYQLPLLFALAGKGPAGVARDVGDVYGANTAGSVLGALLGGFLLLPSLGAPRLWLFCGGLLGGIALLLLRRGWRQQPAVAATVAGLVGVGLLAGVAEGPTALWRHTGIGAGRASLHFPNRTARRAGERAIKAGILEEHEGRESALAIKRGDSLAVLVNGKSDGDARSDAPTTVGLGLLPAILHGAPERAYVIGLGSGQTAGWLASIPGMEQVDVAELEPAMTNFARACETTNQGLLGRDNVRLRLGDGREGLMTATDRYDIIASEPSNPYRAGVSSFYSQDFYQLVAERLAPGGWFAQWVQGYEIDPEALRVVIATLRSVFPEVSIWSGVPNDFLLLATMEPQRLDVAAVAERLHEPPYHHGFGRVMGVWSVEGLLSYHLARPAFATLLAQNVGLHTDDFPVLEFMFARSVGRSSADILTQLNTASRGRTLDTPEVEGEVRWPAVRALRRRVYDIVGRPSPPAAAPEGFGPADRFFAAYLASDMRAATAEAAQLPVPEGDGYALVSLAELFAVQPEQQERYEPLRDRVAGLGLRGDVAWLEFAHALALGSTGEELTRVAGAALGALRVDPFVHSPLVRRVLARLRNATFAAADASLLVEELLAAPFAAGIYDGERRVTALQLWPRSAHSGLPALCLRAFDGPLPQEEWLLALQLDCHERHAAERVPSTRAALDELRAAAAVRLALEPGQ